jgi:hypothetical protein
VPPAVAVAAPYALIVNVCVEFAQPGLLTVMVNVIVAPLVISFVLKVYVGVYPVEPDVILPGLPDELEEVQSTVPFAEPYPAGTV